MEWPITAKDNTTDEFYGTTIADPYRWLEADPDHNPEVKQWIQDQNKATQQYLKTIAFKSKIKQTLLNTMNYTRIGLPFQEGDAIYYFKNDGLQNQPVLQQQTPTTTSLFLDPNSISSLL